MHAYKHGANTVLVQLGLLKVGRFIGKDFMAGVDPTGTYTTSYGIEDADTTGATPWVRGAAGVTGGLIGGGLFVPSAISGLVSAPGGYAAGKLPGMARSFWQGFKAPIQGVYQGARSARALGRASKKGLTPKEVSLLHNVSGGEVSNMAEMVQPHVPQQVSQGISDALNKKVQHYATHGMTAKQYNKIPQAAREHATDTVKSQLGVGLSTLGLAGTIGAGSAGVQYAKGLDTGKYMSPTNRKAFVEGKDVSP